MALKTVTWLLIIGCLAAVAVSAPTSVEDSSSEESTTVGVATVPGTLPESKKTKRETDKQEAQKPETLTEDWKKPTESADTASPKANDRLSRAAEEQKPESETGKPSGDISDAKEDESKIPQKRETSEKKDDLKKPAPTQSKPEIKRPQRDLAGVGETQKKEDSQPTSSPDVKKEEKQQKRHVKEDKESKKVGATRDSTFLRRPLSTIAEEPDKRPKRAVGPHKPQVSRPRPNAPTNNHPGIRPQNNYPGNRGKTQQQPGSNRKPDQSGGSHGRNH